MMWLQYSNTYTCNPLHTPNTEDDGVRQVSPESPSKLLVPEIPLTKVVIEEIHEADDMSVSLTVPMLRNRKNSDVTKPQPW